MKKIKMIKSRRFTAILVLGLFSFTTKSSAMEIKTEWVDFIPRDLPQRSEECNRAVSGDLGLRIVPHQSVSNGQGMTHLASAASGKCCLYDGSGRFLRGMLMAGRDECFSQLKENARYFGIYWCESQGYRPGSPNNFKDCNITWRVGGKSPATK